VLQFAFYLTALVLGGAVEELLPEAFGVGFPVLMALAVVAAVRRPAAVAVLFALAAGATEDALSSLPTMASPCFFLVVAVLVRRTGFWRIGLMVAYPVYQVWLKLVVACLPGSFGMRMAGALPVAAVTVLVVGHALAWVERKAAIHEA